MRRFAVAIAAAFALALAAPITAYAQAQGVAAKGPMITLAEVTLLLFTVTNSARILAYVPQIWRAMRTDYNGAQGISCMSWALFLVSNLTTVAYAVVNLGDWPMAIIFLGSAVGCAAIIAIALWRRKCRGGGSPSPEGHTTR